MWAMSYGCSSIAFNNCLINYYKITFKIHEYIFCPQAKGLKRIFPLLLKFWLLVEVLTDYTAVHSWKKKLSCCI